MITLTSDNDFVLITKAGTFLLIMQKYIAVRRQLITAARLSQVGRVPVCRAQGRASQPFAESEEKWHRSLTPTGISPG